MPQLAQESRIGQAVKFHSDMEMNNVNQFLASDIIVTKLEKVHWQAAFEIGLRRPC